MLAAVLVGIGLYAGSYLSIRTFYHSFSQVTADRVVVSLEFPFSRFRDWFGPCRAVDKILTGKTVTFAPDDFPMKREFRPWPFNLGGGP